MQNEKFYPAKEMKNHFEATIESLQLGTFTHTKKKSATKGKKVLGMRTYEIANPSYITEGMYEKAICKAPSARLPFLTIAEWIYED